MLEKDFEDILCQYPELVDDGLKLIGRQINIYGKFIDILFQDKFGQRLIVELKRGTITRKDIGQIMEYEGNILHEEDPTARVMLIGNRVPPSLKKALDHHGIEWKEITTSELRKFLQERNDERLNIFLPQRDPLNDDKEAQVEEKFETKDREVSIKVYNPGYRSREKRRIGTQSRGAQLILSYLQNKKEAATMREIASYMHSKGFRSKTFFDWSNGLVKASLAEETRKDGRKAYKAIKRLR